MRFLLAASLAPLMLCMRAEAQSVLPSAVILDGSTTIGTSSATILSACPNVPSATLPPPPTLCVDGTTRRTLAIFVDTPGCTVAVNPNGPAALNTPGSVTFSTFLNFADFGAIPNTAIQAIASMSGCTITVWGAL